MAIKSDKERAKYIDDLVNQIITGDFKREPEADLPIKRLAYYYALMKFNGMEDSEALKCAQEKSYNELKNLTKADVEKKLADSIFVVQKYLFKDLDIEDFDVVANGTLNDGTVIPIESIESYYAAISDAVMERYENDRMSFYDDVLKMARELHNYYNMLPVYIAQLTFDRNKWYNNDNTLRTFDRKYDYTTCNELLKRSLIFTCLYRNNHMVTKKQGSYLIVNQLCFDSNTVALNKLNSLTLDESDKKLIKRWESLLSIAKQTDNYKANYKYGVYQIMQELDTFQEVQKGLTIEKKYDNPDLHNNIIRLNKDVKKYYDELIEPLLFEYELIK